MRGDAAGCVLICVFVCGCVFYNNYSCTDDAAAAGGALPTLGFPSSSCSFVVAHSIRQARMMSTRVRLLVSSNRTMSDPAGGGLVARKMHLLTQSSNFLSCFVPSLSFANAGLPTAMQARALATTNRSCRTLSVEVVGTGSLQLVLERTALLPRVTTAGHGRCSPFTRPRPRPKTKTRKRKRRDRVISFSETLI